MAPPVPGAPEAPRIELRLNAMAGQATAGGPLAQRSDRPSDRQGAGRGWGASEASGGAAPGMGGSAHHDGGAGLAGCADADGELATSAAAEDADLDHDDLALGEDDRQARVQVPTGIVV